MKTSSSHLDMKSFEDGGEEEEGRGLEREEEMCRGKCGGAMMAMKEWRIGSFQEVVS